MQPANVRARRVGRDVMFGLNLLGDCVKGSCVVEYLEEIPQGVRGRVQGTFGYRGMFDLVIMKVSGKVHCMSPDNVLIAAVWLLMVVVESCNSQVIMGFNWVLCLKPDVSSIPLS